VASDLNDKNPVWNSQVSNPSDEKLLELFDNNDFQVSAPQYPTHYTPQRNDDVFNAGLHKNI
jgi:hypothetical protein